MYEKFLALAFVLAATVAGQDCDPYYDDCSDTADSYPCSPAPTFPHHDGFGGYMEIPEEAAGFMSDVQFGHFTDTFEALDDWVAGFDWDTVSYSAPNYETFYGIVGYWNEPKFGERVHILFYSENWDVLTNWWGFYATGFQDGEFTDAGTFHFPIE